MTSTNMMIFLCLFYAGIVGAALLERNWPRAMYFVGAITITVAVMWMGRR